MMWELQVKFYLGQHGDWNQGDSTLGSSEKLLQRGRGMINIHVILVQGEYMYQAQIFWRFLLESWNFC